MEARSQAQCTLKGNEMNFIPNLTAFSWKRWSEPLPGKKITRVKLESRKLKSELALGSGRSSCSRWVAQLNQPRSGSR